MEEYLKKRKRRLQNNKQIKIILEIFYIILDNSNDIRTYKVFSKPLYNKMYALYDELSEHWYGQAHR
jgi:hypothetical protein